jgi:hypothetical protein
MRRNSLALRPLELNSVAFHVHSQTGLFSTILKNGETQKILRRTSISSWIYIYIHDKQEPVLYNNNTLYILEEEPWKAT